jgi:hypothetical protein
MTVDQIRQMASAGQLSPESLISTSAAGPWHPASSARGLHFAKAAPVAEVASTIPPPLPTIVPVADTAPPTNRSAKSTGNQRYAVILIGSVLLICVIIGGIYALVSNPDTGSDTSVATGDPTLEACVTCGKNVSANATVCPHCGEPNPSPSFRKAIAAEEARQAEELRRKGEAETALIDARSYAPEFLTREAQDVLLLSEDAQVAGMRHLLDKGQSPFNEAGRKAITAFHAAIKAGEKEEAFKILNTARNELLHSKTAESFNKLRTEI